MVGSSIRSWLRALLWEAPDGPEEQGLHVLIVVAEAPAAGPAQVDAVLSATSADGAVELLRELAALGTTSVVRVLVPDDTPPGERRRIDRAGRALRAEGVWVSVRAPTER